MTRPPLVVALTLFAFGCSSPSPPPWSAGLSSTSALYASRRGLSVQRGIIHLHSVYSHDACDNTPVLDGAPNAVCRARLRDAVCATHQDFIMLTDHAELMTETRWDDLFLPSDGDEAIVVDGKHVASRLVCPDQTSTLVMVGGENALMPVGLEGHVAEEPFARATIMRGTDAASIASMRAKGALILVPHTESRSIDELRAAAPDAIEIYNLHANLDPGIRMEMGLDPTTPLTALSPFLGDRTAGLESDLALLAFVENNTVALDKWKALLQEGRHVAGTFGSDAHENAVPIKLRDGDRGDSYRRILRWFSNHLLVADSTPAALKDALTRGRFYSVFETLGAPLDFDFHAEVDGATVEMGGTVAASDAPTIIVTPPRIVPVPGAPQPTRITTRLYRIDAEGEQLLESLEGEIPIVRSSLVRGAYRVEVEIIPYHLVGYMGALGQKLVRALPWVYANPIYVE